MTSTSDQILFTLKTRGPARTGDLADGLGLTRQGARQQLEKLAAEGLVTFSDERDGVGRPRRLWSLDAAGHARFPDTHAQLSVELLAAIRTEFGDAGLDRLIARREIDSLRAYQHRLEGAADLEQRVRRLAEARSAEGYMAEVLADADGYLLVENHCPICAAAKACQGLCRSELEVFRQALRPDCRVERTDHILAGARRCAYRITAVGRLSSHASRSDAGGAVRPGRPSAPSVRTAS
ncbi:MAG: transcriptional regulator [Caulobacteraceae bacterium]|nr:transcriptional regulator [Caulobacteraceae bacterium]